MQIEGIDKLVSDHWNYIQSLLEQHKVGKDDMEVIKFHYQTAFRHGYKHGVEYNMNTKI